MAKVIRIREYGGPSVLHVEEETAGTPGPNHVRLDQKAVGINAVDVLVRKGLYPLGLPAVPGFEAAGVIESVGSGVTEWAAGDRVGYFFAQGAYASQSIIPAGSLVRLPEDISEETAATYLAKGLTAWMGIRALYDLAAGEMVLVLGASGSVGSILSRWAKHLGATVIGVAGSEGKLTHVAAGATHALFAGDPAIAAKIRAIAPDGVDIVFDFVGQATFAIGAAAVRDGGVIAAIGAVSGQPEVRSDLTQRGVQIRSGGTPQYVRGPTVALASSQLWEALRLGIFADLETVRYPFDEVVRAHADMDGRRLAGLPVLQV